jgi:hypothetical protein
VGRQGQGNAMIEPRAFALGTTELPNAAVNFKDRSAAGPLVQSVDVLGNQRETRHSPLQIGQSKVACIGLSLAN